MSQSQSCGSACTTETNKRSIYDELIVQSEGQHLQTLPTQLSRSLGTYPQRQVLPLLQAVEVHCENN